MHLGLCQIEVHLGSVRNVSTLEYAALKTSRTDLKEAPINLPHLRGKLKKRKRSIMPTFKAAS